MATHETLSIGSRCLDPGCDHPDSVHTPTPELASPGEAVVYCSACHHHEVRRARGGWRRVFGSGRAHGVRRRAGPT